ncbi:MAG: SDR family oxidoreductase [Gammaproteobacteria bacterium]|nr:SDR family oxidoreductase [Gammaproteobacteria bacterium]
MKKILITGVSGYIGGRLIEHLYQYSQYEIHATSRHVPTEIKSKFPLATFYDLDISKSSRTLEQLCSVVDCIIHLAAVNEIVSLQDPVKAVEINCVASIRLLELAKKNPRMRFIYLSTAHVYGSPLSGCLTEVSDCNPSHPYSITHKVVEDFVLTYHKKQQISGVVLRLSNSFGAPLLPNVDRWSLLVNDIVRNVIETKRIKMKSDGRAFRDFITLTDVCCAIQFFIDTPRDNLLDGLFNLGGKNTMRVIDMVEIIRNRCRAVFGFTPELNIPEATSVCLDGTEKLVYEMKKLEALGFSLVNNIYEEIDRMLLFCQNAFSMEAVYGPID